MILRRAAEGARAGTSKSRPPATTVTRALLQLEREQKRNKSATSMDALAGRWQLTVTGKVGRKVGLLERPLYFPVAAHQTFTPDPSAGSETGTFDNRISAGGCSLRFRGPYRWIARMNRLEFTFSSCTVKLGPLGPFSFNNLDPAGGALGTRTAKTLPFFTFFLARNGLAAARGRGGGVALYRRVPAGEESHGESNH
jgi:hypothetical protein